MGWWLQEKHIPSINNLKTLKRKLFLKINFYRVFTSVPLFVLITWIPPYTLHANDFCTFLHGFIVYLHVHHGRCAVPQDLPVSSITLITRADLIRPLIRPPQLITYTTWITSLLFRKRKEMKGSRSVALYLPMIASAEALFSLPLTASNTSSPDPSSLQRLMVLFPELIQYSCSVSKSMDRPEAQNTDTLYEAQGYRKCFRALQLYIIYTYIHIYV